LVPSVDSLPASRSDVAIVTRGTLVYFVGTLLFIGMTFVWRVILIRTLSLEGWSEFSDALAIASSVATVGGLGLQYTLARNIPYASSDAERRAIVRSGLFIGGLSCAAAPIALYFAGPVIASLTGSGDLGVAIQFLGLAYGLSTAVVVFTAVFQGFEDVWPASLFGLILGPTLFAAVLAALYVLPGAHLDLSTALWAFVAAWVVTFTGAVIYTSVRLPRVLPPGPRTHGQAMPLVLFALPLLGVAIFSFLSGYADTIILGAHQLASVGAYVATLTLSRLLPIGVGALASIMLPVTSRLLKNRDRRNAELIYVTATKWTAVFALPLFLVFAFLPSGTLALVYGSGYSSSATLLTIVAIGAFLSTIMGPAAAIQLAVGQTRLLLANAGASLAADVLIALLLVPGYGAVGAAVAWAVAVCVYPALTVAELAVLEGLNPFRRAYFVPLLVTGLPGALVLYAASHFSFPFWALIPITVVLAALYVLAVPLTGSVDLGDALLLEVVEGYLGRRIELAHRFLAWGSRHGRHHV
jgi:O-antigen/teichoic acid export membrane protein